MALDFPANPVNGQVYGSYTYNSAVGAWQAREDARTVAVLSSTVPASANPGDIWINTNDGIAFVYYDDGNSSQWIELLPSGVPLLNTKADLSGATFTGNVTAPRFISTQATGTAPLQVASTTAVTNLNADLLDGNHATAFAPSAGSSNITTLGTVTSGTWSASTIDISKGGTGGTTISEAQTNLEMPLSHNYAINGGFDIWQRGTSFSSTTGTVFTADRWHWTLASGQTMTVSQGIFTPGTEPDSSLDGTNFLNWSVSGTWTGAFWFNNRIEDVRTLAGSTVTLSFWVKGTSAYTNSSFRPRLVQNFGTGGSANVNTSLPAMNITTGWTRYETTVTLPSISGKTVGTNSFLALQLFYGDAGSTGIVGNTLSFAGVQLELGSVATPFRRNSNNIQAERAACQRYYYRISGADNHLYGVGLASTTAVVRIYVPFKVTMRVPPTSFEYAALYVGDGQTPHTSPSSVVLDIPSENGTRIFFNKSSPFVQYRPYELNATVPSSYIAFNAEI